MGQLLWHVVFAGSFGLSNWDKYLVDSSGNHPANNSTGTPGNFNQVANPIWFTGPNAVAYYGGNVPVHAPSPFEGGSSLSHLDETFLPNALMSPQIGPGRMDRAPTRLEWEIMEDLGWNVLTTLNWNHGAGTLNWTDAANWDNPSAPPDATWDVVLTTDSTAGFALGGTSGTLTFVKGNLTRTAASSGTQTLARPIVLGTSAIWDIDGTGQLAVTGGISGSGLGITKRSAGIATNHAAVILDGPSSLFAKLDAIAANEGTLTILDGRTLATTADFSNSGSVTIGAGSVLEVAGTYTQTAGDTAVGGQLKADAGWADILDGTMELGADAGAGGALLSLDVVGATVYFDSDQHLDTLDIGTGGKVVFRGAKLVVLSNFQMDGLSLGPMTLTPEPATVGLLAFGGLAMLWRHQRKHAPRKRGG